MILERRRKSREIGRRIVFTARPAGTQDPVPSCFFINLADLIAPNFSSYRGVRRESAAFEGAVPDFEFSIKAFFLEIEGYKSHHLPTGKFIFFPVEGVSDVHGSPRSGIQIRFVDNIIFISDRVQGHDFMTISIICLSPILPNKHVAR